jgi:3-oxoacyl-[acyl-carrier protein] reductase
MAGDSCRLRLGRGRNADVSRLSGRVAVVTGASRGIGRAIAVSLAREGADVAVNFRHDRAAAAEVVAEVVSLGRDAVALQGDVSRAADVARVVGQAAGRWGTIDIVVNNAGTTSFLPLPELDEAEFDRVLDVNLKSVFLVTKAALPHISREGRGRVINVSSTSGLLGPPLSSHYCAAKAGVNGFTRACATELREHNITVNAICPGGTETRMLLPHLAAQGFELDSPDLVGPMRRLARPTDIAGAAVFLASDDAAWMTGALLVVDGGLSVR